MGDTEERVRSPMADNDRGSILAELAAARSAAPAPAAEEAAEPAPAKPDAPANGAAPDPEPDDDDADDLDDDEPDEDADDDDDEDGAAAADADTQRRLAIVQRADKRRREALATERAAFEAERERWRQEQTALTDKASRHDGLGSRFAMDPVGVAMELDVPEDQYEYIAEQFFRLSKKAQEDPRHKEAARIARLERQIAERDRREKEQASKAEESRKAQEAAEAASKQGAAYLDKLIKRSTEGTAAKLAKGAPQLLRRQLGQLALELMGNSTELPPAKRVLREYEKRKREEYAALGFTVAEGVAADKAAATSTDKTAAKPAAKPAADAAAAPANGTPRKRGNDAERRGILADLRAARQRATE